MRLRLFHWIVLAWLPVSASWAQEVPHVQPQATPRQFLPEAPIAKSREPDERPPRLFWIIPTFTVSDSKAPTALSSRQKFRMFFDNNTDPFTISSIAFAAGVA